jgi:phosphotriesterase-related protein
MLEQLIFDQIEIFEDEGVDLRRVIIGHLGDYRDMARLRAIAAKGVYLQIDHIGWEVPQKDHQRAATVAQLVREGYVSQILLSMDICVKSRLHWFGGHGYDYLLQRFVPLLRQNEVTEAEIRTMIIDNPARALAFDV